MLETAKYKGVTLAKGLNTNMGAHIGIYLYTVDGLLIDCGPQSMRDDIAAFLKTQELTQAVLTHLHEDHAGMAAWVHDNLNIPIYLDAADIPEARREGEYAEYRHLTWGERPAFDPLELPARLTTEKYSFDVIAAPGHMAHHNVLLERNEGWLFSGDLYVRSKLRFCAAEEDMKQYMASLEKVLKLDFGTVFCAHAGVLENGREKLEQKLSFLRELQQRVNELRAKGLTDREIDGRIFPGEQIITEVSDGEWSSYNIIKSI